METDDDPTLRALRPYRGIGGGMCARGRVSQHGKSRVVDWDVQREAGDSWAWPILGVRHFSDINRALLLEAGASLNLAKGTAGRLLESLRSRAAREAEALYAEVETENAGIARARPELSATMAGESRCLRAILHAVLKEMVKRIA